MKFITKKDSATGLKFQEVAKKQKVVFKAQKEFAQKYGFKEWRGAYMTVCGGISSLCTPNFNLTQKFGEKEQRKANSSQKRIVKKG